MQPCQLEVMTLQAERCDLARKACAPSLSFRPLTGEQQYMSSSLCKPWPGSVVTGVTQKIAQLVTFGLQLVQISLCLSTLPLPVATRAFDKAEAQDAAQEVNSTTAQQRHGGNGAVQLQALVKVAVLSCRLPTVLARCRSHLESQKRCEDLQYGSTDPVLGEADEQQNALPLDLDDGYDNCPEKTEHPQCLIQHSVHILHWLVHIESHAIGHGTQDGT
mmetsp:Transcript_20645/g.62200  ORF Transcript_20645/g.62200 Transcript_20645/m.62200 type:complete len:218 (-) Transcript_20645:532-1185(-)